MDLARGTIACGRAEFAKIWASRVPLVMLAAIPAGCYLFVFELFHVERVADHLVPLDPLRVVAILYFATWKALLFQATAVAFAAYWTTVDSQYGMIRVATCQPITRTEYLAGKWIGISAHVATFTSIYVLSLLAWTTVYIGVGGLTLAMWPALVRFGIQVVVFTLAVSTIASAVASLRTTVSAGMITALLTMIGLALATMVPFDVLAPRFVFMRYFAFALGELPNPFDDGRDSPFSRLYSVGDFYRTVLTTTLSFVVVAVWRFRSRDIEE